MIGAQAASLVSSSLNIYANNEDKIEVDDMIPN